jgi:hypothetical protein
MAALLWLDEGKADRWERRRLACIRPAERAETMGLEITGVGC